MTIVCNGAIGLYTETRGPDDGPVLVLSTGFDGQLSYWPEELLKPIIDAGYRIVLFDTRDAGLSSDGSGYTMDDLAGDLLAVVAAYTKDPVDLLGYSMGGQIAMRATLQKPDAVRSLSLIFTTSGAEGLSQPPMETNIASLTLAQRQNYEPAIEARTKLMELAAGPLAPFDSERAREEAIATHARSYRPEGIMGHVQALMNSAPIADRLGEITKPCLILQATHDCFFVEDHGEDLARRLNCSVEVIDGAGHDIIGGVASCVATAFIAFQARNG
jgi:pimeloyl-ACP methyl ester carboxylesterase